MDGRRMIGGVASGFGLLALSAIAVLHGIRLFGLDPTGRMMRRMLAPLNDLGGQLGVGVGMPRVSNVSDVLLGRWESPLLTVAVAMLVIAVYAEGFGPVLYRLGRTASLLSFLGIVVYSAPQVLATLTSSPQMVRYPAALETQLVFAFGAALAVWALGYLLRPDYNHH
jgi:hypothetical protein